MNASTAEDKRFEAALRIFIAALSEGLGRGEMPNADELPMCATAAVHGADVLLAALRKEKP